MYLSDNMCQSEYLMKGCLMANCTYKISFLHQELELFLQNTTKMSNFKRNTTINLLDYYSGIQGNIFCEVFDIFQQKYIQVPPPTIWNSVTLNVNIVKRPLID